MHRIWRKHRKYENYLFHPMDCCNYSWSGHWCAGTTKEAHEAALAVMKSCQIKIV